MKQLSNLQVSELCAAVEFSIKSNSTQELLGLSLNEARYLQDRLVYATHGFYNDILVTTAPALFKQLQKKGIISKIQ